MSLRAIVSAIVPAAASWLAIAALATGCGASPQANDNVLELDPELVVGDPASAIEVTSAAELLRDGNDLLVAGEPEEALVRYDLILAHFPGTPYERSAFYNSGLCYQELEQWDLAAETFAAVIERWPASSEATDALFMGAEVRSQVGDYESVPPLMERVLRRTRLSVYDEAEAHLRWADAAIEYRDYPTAEYHYRQVIEVNRRAQETAGPDAPPEERPLDDFNPLLTQAYFGLGRTYHELFLEIKLVLPEAVIRQALLDKAQLMEQARLAYLDAVRAGDPYWSVAAGFMIGQIYEDLFLDILACEVPHDFDELTVEVYFEELRAYLDPVLRRALSIYEDNLAMAERLGSDSVWVEETRTAIDRTRSYLEDPDVRREQERLILLQRHPHGARDPSRRWVGPSTPDS